MSDISPPSPAKLQAEIRKLLPLLHKAAGKAKVSPQAVMMTAAGLAVHVIKRHCETKVDALQHVTAAMWDDLAAALDAPGHDDARNDRATGGRPQRGGGAICRRRRHGVDDRAGGGSWHVMGATAGERERSLVMVEAGLRDLLAQHPTATHEGPGVPQ